jgi:hypothetical protein
MSILAAIKREEKKAKEQIGQIAARIERVADCSKGSGRFGEPRSDTGQEALVIGGRQGKNLRDRFTTVTRHQREPLLLRVPLKR